MVAVNAFVWALLHFSYLTSYLFEVQPKLIRSVSTTHVVVISNMRFAPENLLVNIGDSVVFQNNDMVTHDVTETTENLWRSPALDPGQKWSIKVTQGTAYFCSYHPVMKGRIRVKK